MVLGDEDTLTATFLVLGKDKDAKNVVLRCVAKSAENFPIGIQLECWLEGICLIESAKEFHFHRNCSLNCVAPSYN
jgi:hypothetical protein